MEYLHSSCKDIVVKTEGNGYQQEDVATKSNTMQEAKELLQSEGLPRDARCELEPFLRYFQGKYDLEQEKTENTIRQQ